VSCAVLQFTVFVVRCFGFNTSSTNDIFGRSKVFSILIALRHAINNLML